MTQAPFAIDEVNLAEILGEQKIVQLSTEFYNRVYEDKEEWFLSMFPKGDEGKKVCTHLNGSHF